MNIEMKEYREEVIAHISKDVTWPCGECASDRFQRGCSCPRWELWFRKRWNAIRRAAGVTEHD